MKTESVQSAQNMYSTTGCSLQGVHREEYCSVIVGAGELTRTFFFKLEHVDTLTVNVMSR